MADRYALVFLPVTAVVAGVAWAVSGDPCARSPCFVVATPCPLILAAPIALISGVSRAARVGVVVKGARRDRAARRGATVLLDKTGTLTLGTPEVERVVALDGVAADEVLRLAASLDQLSAHPLCSRARARGAERGGSSSASPSRSRSGWGRASRAVVDGRRVAVGSRSWLDPARAPTTTAPGMLVQRRRQARRRRSRRRPAARGRGRPRRRACAPPGSPTWRW